MSFIKKLGDGKSQVQKDKAFCTLLSGVLPNLDTNIKSLFDELDIKVREEDPNITREALSNVHGDWYEWLLSLTAWNYFVANSGSSLAISLPNIIQFDVASLYNQDLFWLIEDLRHKVEETSKVKLITSNPDFVIINRQVAIDAIGDLKPILRFDEEVLNWLSNLHQSFISRCSFSDIIGFISVKTSLRPDRRLQISHEGSLMKAIYTHLQTRQWIIEPAGLKYYAMATSVKAPDRKALKTVATHSITTVSSLPQAAVDEVFEVNTLQSAQDAFEKIL